MNIINISKKEKNIIAEFIYSSQNDILIKSDCIKLVEVFKNHNIIVSDDKKYDVIYLYYLIVINKL